MEKILKNTTLSDIEIQSVGITVPASGQITIQVQDYLLLASDDSIAELTPLINSGDIVVNNSVEDLFPIKGINFIKYQDNYINGNTVHLSPTAISADADGTSDHPFINLTQIKDALDAGFISTPLVISCDGGNISQDPVDFSGYTNITIKGDGPRTRFVATNPNADLLTLGSSQSLRSVSFEGVTNASNYMVKFSGTGNGVGSVNDIFFTNGSNGITVENTTGIFRVTLTNSLSTNMTGDYFTCNSNCVFTISSITGVGNTTTSKGIVQNGSGEVILFTARLTNYGTSIEVNGNTGFLQLIGLTSINETVVLQQNGNCRVEVLGGNFDARTANITNTDVLTGYFFSETEDEEQLRVISELSVGLAGNGKESSLGEGDSYYSGSLVFEFDGSTFTNVSSSSQNPISGTFGIPNTSVNSALYVSTAFPDKDGNYQSFPGIKVDLATGAVLGSGEIVAEYWDGSAWVEFNHMSEGELDVNYQKYAKAIFQRSASEQVLFDDAIEDDWTANDPMSLGINLFWVRFRIDSAITTAPVFNSIKIHTDRTEANSDGYIQYFGKARRYKQLSSDITYIGTVRIPGDQDVYLSDFLNVGKEQNEFFAGGLLSQSDLAGSVFKLPTDCDTSSVALLDITYYSTDTGTLELYVDWSNSRDGDIIYESTGAAPTNGARQQTVIVQDTAYNVSNRQRTFTIPLNISDFIARDSDGNSDLFWVSLNISNGTTLNPMTLINVSLRYLSNESGGHL